jgi:hypothetical protein
MKFTTPCFIRVDKWDERKELMEWLKSIGYTTAECRKKDLYVVATSVTITGEPMSAYARTYPANIHMPSLYEDCGFSVSLFKALAAMNDENDREQLFKCYDAYSDALYMIGRHEMSRDKYFARTREPGAFYRKATAEEIIKHFKNK